MINIDVVTGFLGSGKTTLIKAMMQSGLFDGEKVVIIENEFGEVPIDDQILENEGYSLVEISGGCICCSLKGDIIEALDNLAINEQPDRILIEPSGIFMLNDLAQILEHKLVADRYQLDSIITVVDADNFMIDRMRHAPFFESQVRHATDIVISKLEKGLNSKAGRVIEKLKDYNTDAAVYALDFESIDKAVFEGMMNKGPVDLSGSDQGNGHVQMMTIGMKNIKAFSKETIDNLLKKISDEGFGNVIRAKGYLPINGKRHLLQYVSGEWTLELVEDGPTRLIFIGEALEQRSLRRAFKKIALKFN